ncbi:MAG: tandem-95 repeat protein [Planctomycetaceae bacterium]|nr:tandem-95 repeat protein [Planctomycetaceae bacterium]
MKLVRGWMSWREWKKLWRKPRSLKSRLLVEGLEQRLVLSGAPPVANADSYTGYYDTGVTGNNAAVISTPYPGMTSLGSINLGYAASQIEYSPSSNLLFVREGTSKVHVVNATTGVELSSRTPSTASTVITDIDLTPDGRYLYVADYGGTNIGYGTPSTPSYIQQYDTVTATWSSKATTGIVYRIEGVNSTRCISLEQDQWVDVLLYDYGVGTAPTSIVTSVYGSIVAGNIEFDHRTGRILHGNSGSSSADTAAFQLTGNSITRVQASGLYTLPAYAWGDVALSNDGNYFYYRAMQFYSSNVVQLLRTFGEPIYAGAGNLAIGSSQYYDAATGASLGTMPFSSTVYGVADDLDELWAFNSTNNSLVHYRLPSYGRGVLANDTDAEYDPLTASVVTPPIHGTLNLASNGTFTYAPTGGYTGLDSFQYRANDGTGNSSVATVTLTLLDNHPPTVTDVADRTVNEDVISSIPVVIGDVETAAASLTFTATASNSTLFPPSGIVINGSGANRTLVLTPAANLSGTATITLTATDARGAVTTDQFVVTVNSSNDPPSFTKGANPIVLEDSGAISLPGWVTNISPGPANEASQTVTFFTSNNNASLFSVQPTVSSTGVLNFSPAANANGTATVTIYATDNGGTTNGGNNYSGSQTFTVTVTAVNDQPSFTKGANVSAGTDSGLMTVTNWATSITKGPSNESTQTLTFDVTSDNPSLFSIAPAISATGTLTFTPATGQSGIANVSVTLRDNGGTTNGGIDTSLTQTFVIDVGSRNSPPLFTIGASPTVLEDTASATLTGWVTSISPGLGSFDVGQTVAFTVTAGTPSLFAVQPSISSSGTLTFTPAANAFGTTTISVFAVDNGGVANGGSNTSATQTFTINITGINDAPTFTSGANITIAEDAVTQTFSNWATAISVGPNESSVQTPTFVVTNNNNALFSTQPTINSLGTLSFRSVTNASGSATVTVQLRDNGGTINGGIDYSAIRTFTITVTAANDAPTLGTSSFAVLKSAANPLQLPIDDGDPEVSQALTVAVTAQPTHGTISGLNSATGSLIYTPVPGYTGSDAFTVTITDDATAGGSALTTTRTITLSVGSVYSIAVSNPRDIVWDATRSQVYVSNSSGSIYRYDPVNRTTLAPLTVGGALGGFDIMPDGSALYIADGQPVGNQGFVKKLNLATSGVTSLPYTLDFGEAGAFDVGVGANGVGFFTTNYSGSGWTPFRQINLATNALTVRTDSPGSGFGGEVRQSTQIYRSYDHTKLAFFEQNSSAGPFFVFNSATNSFPAQRDLNEFYTRFAVSRDNAKIAWQSWNGTLTILNASTLATLNTVGGIGYAGGGGVAFDPVRDILYAADANNNEIVAYRTSDWQAVTRVSLGTSIDSSNTAYCQMTISDDGNYLFYTSPTDVRVVPLTSLFSTATINGEAYSGTEDTALNVSTALGLLANDVLPNPNLTVVVKIAPAHGAVTVNSNGSFVYTPTANYQGTDSFTYTVRSNGTPLGDAIATIQLAAVNDAPLLDTSVTLRLPAEALVVTNNVGARLTDIMASVAPLDVITDVDGAGFEGIAIFGVDSTNGAWDYSRDDGATWSSLSTVSTTTARLLQVNTQTRLRFTPTSTLTSGVTASLSYRAWDGTQGTVGATANISTVGGASAFSNATGTLLASVAVTGVTTAGTRAIITGSSAVDSFSVVFVGTTGIAVTFNGATWNFASPTTTTIEIDGVSGADACTITGSSLADQITFSPLSARLVGGGFTIQVNRVNTNIVVAAANDTAVFNDSDNVDTLYQLPTHSIMVDRGNTYFNEVVGTSRTTGNSTSGDDSLFIYGDASVQTFVGSPSQVSLTGTTNLVANNFRKVYAYGQGGADNATFNGSSANENATLMQTVSTMTSANFLLYLVGIKQTTFNSGGGTDIATMYDSAGSDSFTSSVTQSMFAGSTFRNTVNGYTRVYAFQYNGGADTATMNGSAGNDNFDGGRSYSVMTTGAILRQATNFSKVIVNGGSGGTDTATLRDSLGDDVFTAIGNQAEMLLADGRRIQASAFDRVYAMGTSGGRNRRSVTTPLSYSLSYRGTWI